LSLIKNKLKQFLFTSNLSILFLYWFGYELILDNAKH